MTRTHFILINLVALGSAALPTLLSPHPKVLVDDKGWVLASVNEMDGTLKVLTDGNTHPPIYEVNVLRPGAYYSNLHLEKTITAKDLNLAKPLWLEFRARAETPRAIRATLQDPKAEPWAAEVTLGTAWKTYRLPFKPTQVPSSQGPTILAFQLGGVAGEVTVSEIKLEQS